MQPTGCAQRTTTRAGHPIDRIHVAIAHEAAGHCTPVLQSTDHGKTCTVLTTLATTRCRWRRARKEVHDGTTYLVYEGVTAFRRSTKERTECARPPYICLVQR